MYVRTKGLLLGAQLLLAGVSVTEAKVTTTWTNTGNGTWSVASNWSAGVPGAADTAVLGVSANSTISLANSTAVGTVSLVNPQATIVNHAATLNAQHLQISAGSHVWNNGTINLSSRLVVSNGRLTLAGTARIQASDLYAVHDPGAGTFGALSFNGGSVNATITGTGTHSVAGLSSIYVENGASLTLGGPLQVGGTSVANAPANVYAMSSRIAAQDIYLGNGTVSNNSSQLHLHGNSVVTQAAASKLVIGSNAGSTSVLGFYGPAVLNTGTGGVTIRKTGSVVLHDPGARWNVFSDILVDGGAFNAGTTDAIFMTGRKVTVQNRGTFTAAFGHDIYRGNTVELTSGTFSSPGNLGIGRNGNGTLSFSGPESYLSASYFVLGANGGSGTLLFKNGSTGSCSVPLSVAHGIVPSSAFLRIDGGSQLASGGMTAAGTTNTSTATIQIDGPGSMLDLHNSTFGNSSAPAGGGVTIALSNGGLLKSRGTFLFGSNVRFDMNGGVLQFPAGQTNSIPGTVSAQGGYVGTAAPAPLGSAGDFIVGNTALFVGKLNTNGGGVVVGKNGTLSIGGSPVIDGPIIVGVDGDGLFSINALSTDLSSTGPRTHRFGANGHSGRVSLSSSNLKVFSGTIELGNDALASSGALFLGGVTVDSIFANTAGNSTATIGVNGPVAVSPGSQFIFGNPLGTGTSALSIAQSSSFSTSSTGKTYFGRNATVMVNGILLANGDVTVDRAKIQMQHGTVTFSGSSTFNFAQITDQGAASPRRITLGSETTISGFTTIDADTVDLDGVSNSGVVTVLSNSTLDLSCSKIQPGGGNDFRGTLNVYGGEARVPTNGIDLLGTINLSNDNTSAGQIRVFPLRLKGGGINALSGNSAITSLFELSSGTITVSQGARLTKQLNFLEFEPNALVFKSGDGTFTVSSQLVGETNAVLAVQSGTLELLGNSWIADPGALTIAVNGALRFARDLRFARLHIHPGGLAIGAATPSGPAALLTHELSIAGGSAPTGTLDVHLGGVVVNYVAATPLAGIRDQIAYAHHSGLLDRPGITSSLAETDQFIIGFAEAGELNLTTFLGQTVDSTSVLIRLTTAGDANLDGTTNISDFAILAANFNLGSTWSRGDFNYDSLTGIADFAILAANFNQSVSQLPPARQIPEPSSCVGGVVAAIVAAWRRGTHAPTSCS